MCVKQEAFTVFFYGKKGSSLKSNEKPNEKPPLFNIKFVGLQNVHISDTGLVGLQGLSLKHGRAALLL